MIDWATDLIAAGGLVGVFLLMVLENLFPPIPSEVVMPLAGFAAARGQLSLPGVLLAGIAGSIAGNAVWFELARAFGTVRMRRLVSRFSGVTGLGPERILAAEDALRRNGPAAVFLARMMPGLRTGISIPAGLVELSRPVFYGWTAAGTGLWTTALTMAGYLLEEKFRLVEDYAGPAGVGLLLVVVLVVGWRLLRAKRAAAG